MTQENLPDGLKPGLHAERWCLAIFIQLEQRLANPMVDPGR